MKNEGFFIETVTFNGNYYGTSKKEVTLEKSLAVEFNGAQTFAAQKNKNIVIFYLKIPESKRLERMKLRGDDKEKIELRIQNDRESFVLNDNINSIIDEVVDTEKLNIEEVANFVYKRYKEILKTRKINLPNNLK